MVLIALATMFAAIITLTVSGNITKEKIKQAIKDNIIDEIADKAKNTNNRIKIEDLQNYGLNYEISLIDRSANCVSLIETTSKKQIDIYGDGISANLRENDIIFI